LQAAVTAKQTEKTAQQALVTTAQTAYNAAKQPYQTSCPLYVQQTTLLPTFTSWQTTWDNFVQTSENEKKNFAFQTPLNPT